MGGERESAQRLATHRRRWPAGRLAGVLLVLAAGCNGRGAVEMQTHRGDVRDHVSFVDELRATGLTVDVADPVEQPFFGIPGVFLRVSGGELSKPAELQSFEYERPRDAQKELENIGPGVQFRTTYVNWVASPHLYGVGRILVLYVGDDPEALSLLRRVLGPPLRQGG